MLRNIGAMLAAIVMGVGIVMLGDTIVGRIHTAAVAVDLSDPEQMRAHLESTPFGLMVALVFIFALAVFAAAFTGRRFGKQDFTGWVPAVLLAAMIAATLAAAPYPLWMKLLAGAAVALAAWAGVRLGGRTRKPPPEPPVA